MHMNHIGILHQNTVVIFVEIRKLALFTVRTDYSKVGSRSFQYQNPMNEIGDFSFTDFLYLNVQDWNWRRIAQFDWLYVCLASGRQQ